MTTPSVAQGRTLLSNALWRALLAAASAIAGVMHLVLTPDHFAESTLMGLGFAGAAATELGLAAAVLVRPGRLLYAAVMVVGGMLVALYGYNVFIGLPFAGDHSAAVPEETTMESSAGHGDGEEHTSHHATGLVLGAGEPVDAAGAATKGAELVSIGIAAVLLMRKPTSVDSAWVRTSIRRTHHGGP